LPVAAAHDEHVLAAHVEGAERAGLGEVGAARGRDPAGLEDLLLFPPVDLGVGVGEAGEGGDQARRHVGGWSGHVTPLVGELKRGGRRRGPRADGATWRRAWGGSWRTPRRAGRRSEERRVGKW